MCNNEKDYKSAKEEASDGTFFKLNSNKYFLKIKQCLEIDKVLFAFVKNGTQGKNKIDVYLKADEFDFLCDMILDGTLKQDIIKDDGKYPNAWVRQVGEGGSKKVAIGKGSAMPIVIQAQMALENNENKYIMLGIDRYERLERMARMWRKVSEEYFDEILMACKKATNNYSKEDAEADNNTSETKAEPVQQPEQVPQAEPKFVTMQVTAKSACAERLSKKGDYAMTCCEGNDVKTGKSVNVVIPATAIAKMSEDAWKKFLKRSEDRNTPLTFKGVFKETEENGKKVFVFESFAK